MKAYPRYQHQLELIGNRKIYRRNYRFTNVHPYIACVYARPSDFLFFLGADYK